MSATLSFTRHQARALLLAAQGLLHKPPQVAKADVLAAIRRMGVLQIDTIHVVARSPYLVLFSRLGDYAPHWLDELLAEGALFEYWSHEACFIPMEAYPYYRRLMLEERKGLRNARAWLEQNPQALDAVRAALRLGPVRAADFARSDDGKGQWWNWKAEKQALECLHTLGEVMIAQRRNFQRVYDLRERVLPSWDDAAAPPYDEAQHALTLEAVRCLGLALPRWVADYFRQPQAEAQRALRALAEAGHILRAEVTLSEEGAPELAYLHPASLPLLEGLRATGWDVRAASALLSPFDPIVWDRRRALELFDFDYRIECYTPAPKRKYGYFSLPILWQGQLVGRLDAKAQRAEGVFEVRALHLEAGTSQDEALAEGIAELLRTCAAWHKTPQVRLLASSTSLPFHAHLSELLA